MTLLRMDNVLIVVDDLEAAKAFFAELGMELEGQTQVEGPWVDSTVGLDDVRADIAMMRTPDGHGRVELTTFHAPPAVRAEPEGAPANALGIRRIMFCRQDRRRRRPPAQPRCRTPRRDGAVRGQLPALLHAWPGGHHHRTGRAAPVETRRCSTTKFIQARLLNSSPRKCPVRGDDMRTISPSVRRPACSYMLRVRGSGCRR